MMSSIRLPHNHGESPAAPLIQEQLSHVEHFQTVADVFKQLCDTTRIRIFWLLCHCEECVLNISAMLEMSSPAVSHHLRPLKNSSLIVCRRDGKEVYYRAADTEQSRLLHRMIEDVMEITCPELHKTEIFPPEQNLITEISCEKSPHIEVFPPRQNSITDVTCPESPRTKTDLPEQIQIVQEIHDWLLGHMDQRITIEELSRQFLINPTTLKSAFKSVYGTSIAAHIKEHRMKRAAQLLKKSNLSIAEIAQTVGYDSQSRFTETFKSYFQLLPREYRKKYSD